MSYETQDQTIQISRDEFDEQFDNEHQLQKKSNSQTSSLTTVLAIFNTMVGSVVLVIPINFAKAGLLVSLAIMLFIGYISYLTCTWIVKCKQPGDQNTSQIIQRVLGQKWFNVFSMGSSLQLFVVGIVYFLLINSTLWEITQFIAVNLGYPDIGENTGINFSKYSIQYQSIIVGILFIPLTFIKNIDKLVKIAGYGSIAVKLYILFIIYMFCENLYQGNIQYNFQDIQWVSFDIKAISNIIGSFALAFMIHNAIISLVSNNKVKDEQKQNLKDLGSSFTLSCTVYGLIGSLGMLGLLGKKPQIENPQIIYDYFSPTEISSFIIQLAFLFNLLTVFPIFPYISKDNLFQSLYTIMNKKEENQNANNNENQNKNNNIPTYYYTIYNFVFIVSCLLVQICMIDINYIIGVSGSVIGFLVVYFFPVLIRQSKYYNQCEKIKEQERQQEAQQIIFYESSFQNILPVCDPNMKGYNQYLQSQLKNINQQDDQNNNNKPYSTDKLKGYLIILLGTFFAMLQLIILFY